MNYKLTLFKSLYDNKTDKTMSFEDFAGLEELLYKLSGEYRKDKKSAPLISPASYTVGTTRANDNVEAWEGWAAVDVDAHKFEGNLKDELFKLYGGYYYVCYSTASSTIDHPKFRLVFPLISNVPARKISHFWFALNSELNDIGDIQTKDLSRMYYIPGSYDGANNFIFTNKTNKFINPYELMESYPYIEPVTGLFAGLPPSIRDAMIKEKKAALTNTNITWNGYKDCPFVAKDLIVDYNKITDTGWYHKMYQIMVSIASKAIKRKYPITIPEIVTLCKQIDMDTGQWYAKRPLETEATRALEYVMNNN